MSNSNFPVDLDQIHGNERRNRMMTDVMPDLKKVARKQIVERNMAHDEFTILCIEKAARLSINLSGLMPHDSVSFWNEINRQVPIPAMTICVKFESCRGFEELYPSLSGKLSSKPKQGHARCIAIDKSGVSVYDILPASTE